MAKPLATIGQRILAWIIDLIIISIVSGILGGLGFGALAFGGIIANPAAVLFGLGTVFVLIVVTIIYTLFLEGYWKGQTIGKKVINIRVVDEKSGKPETFSQSFVRNILRIIDNQLVGLVAFILIIATKRRQRIGDMLAHTVVVKE